MLRRSEPCPHYKEGRIWREVIILTTLTHGAQGKPAALSEVWDRSDGKAKQLLEMTGDFNINGEAKEKLDARIAAIAKRRRHPEFSES